ncbi:Spy/CpxP family protein refolding chaperone [Methylocystis echinoides]|uniref:Spy/CpxP family protein refolding chaperone n=1 Tax=Methylocystis echinoides TaxID=29468 RepID=UPI0034269639
MNKFTVASVALAISMAFCTISAQARGARSSNQDSADQGATCRMNEHVDGQLGFIQAELKISEAQVPQWNVFAGAFRADKEKQAQLCAAAQEQARSMATAPLPASMGIMADRLTARLDSVRAMQAAIAPLYAILTPEQKKKADEIMKGVSGM